MRSVLLLISLDRTDASFPAETEGNGSKIYSESLKFQDGPFLCGVIFGRGIGNLGPSDSCPDRS